MGYKDDHDFTSYPRSLQKYQEIKDWVEAKHREGKLEDLFPYSEDHVYKDNLYLEFLSDILKKTGTRSLELADYLVKQEVLIQVLQSDIEETAIVINLLEEQVERLRRRIEELEARSEQS